MRQKRGIFLEISVRDFFKINKKTLFTDFILKVGLTKFQVVDIEDKLIVISEI